MTTATIIATSTTSFYCSQCGQNVRIYEDNIFDHENVHSNEAAPDGGCLSTWTGWATKDPTITTQPQPELWSALPLVDISTVVWGPGVS